MGTTPSLGDVVELLSPTLPLDVDALLLAPRSVRRARRLRPAGTRAVAYGRTAPVTSVRGGKQSRTRRRPTVVRWHLDTKVRPPLRQAVSVSHVLRAAVLSKLGDHLSSTLSGRERADDDTDESRKRTDQHQHAHYLALDSSRSWNTIDTVALWAPEGFGDEELAALASLRVLRPPGYVKEVYAARLGLEGVGGPEVLPEVSGRALRWESVTPFVPGRHHKRGSFEDHIAEEVRRELDWRVPPAARPGVDGITVVDDAKWARFRRHRPGRSMREAKPARFVRIDLTAPVAGPLALGALSHFGMGLFRPVSDDAG